MAYQEDWQVEVYGRKEKFMMKRSKRLIETRSDQIFNIFNTVFLSLVFIVTIYPIIYVVSASFSDSKALFSGKVFLWPVGFTFDGYKAVLQYSKVWVGFRNSLFYTSVGTMINLVVTVLAAYPLSRKDLFGRSKLIVFFAFTIWFSGGIIPTFLLVKNLNIYNTIWAMLLPSALSVYNMLITKTYFENNIPNELLESAQMDGCNDFTFLIKIVIPLSKPVLAVITLFYIVSNWNTFFNALIYLSSESLYPIQLVLREVLMMSSTSEISANMELQSKSEFMAELLKYSMIVISSIPVIIIYPFVQKFFVKGMMIGSVKG